MLTLVFHAEVSNFSDKWYWGMMMQLLFIQLLFILIYSHRLDT